jgi:hypothetical protein
MFVLSLAGKTPVISSNSDSENQITGKSTVYSLQLPFFPAQSSPLTGEIPFIYTAAVLLN